VKLKLQHFISAVSQSCSVQGHVSSVYRDTGLTVSGKENFENLKIAVVHP